MKKRYLLSFVIAASLGFTTNAFAYSTACLNTANSVAKKSVDTCLSDPSTCSPGQHSELENLQSFNRLSVAYKGAAKKAIHKTLCTEAIASQKKSCAKQQAIVNKACGN